jgi:hypothetical protein
MGISFESKAVFITQRRKVAKKSGFLKQLEKAEESMFL